MRTLFTLLCLTALPYAHADGDPSLIDIPSTYNGVRCKTRERAGDLYLDVYRGQLGSFYWIAHDHVRVLSTQLTAVGHVISGHDTATNGTYVFDYDHSDFKFVDSAGKEELHYVGMSCVLCPADMDHCPGT